MSLFHNNLLLSIITLLLTAQFAAASTRVVPIQYDSNRKPWGNSWYVDNGYTGTSGGGLSGGVGELVDGIKGTPISVGYSEWEPYSLIDVGGSAADIIYTFHFDQAYVWDSIEQYQQIFHGAAVYQPSGFEVSFSIDGGTNYHSTIIRSMSAAESSQTRGLAQYSLLGVATGYHADVIRIVLKQPSRWSATDEVEFFASSIVPEPSSFAFLAGTLGLACATCFRRR